MHDEKTATGTMEDALRRCRDQFAFYAREHEAAGKGEKAATNRQFAQIAEDALSATRPPAQAGAASVEVMWRKLRHHIMPNGRPLGQHFAKGDDQIAFCHAVIAAAAPAASEEIPGGMGGDNNPCRNCGTEYPRPMQTAANSSPDELARIQLLADVELHLQSVRIFLTKREKMHPCGVDLHDELQARVTAALSTPKASAETGGVS